MLPSPRTMFMGLFLASSAATTANALVCEGECAPHPDNGFIARYAGGSAVAVGPRTLISAKHVGTGGTVHGDGWTANVVSVDYPDAGLDLQLVTVDQDLPGWHRIAPAVDYAQEVVLGGWGLGGSGEMPVAWGTSREQRWGTSSVFIASSYMILTRMAPGNTPYESTFVAHDSGAGLFVEGASGELFLAGVAVSASARNWNFSNYGDRAGALNIISTNFTGLDYATVEQFNEPAPVEEAPAAVAEAPAVLTGCQLADMNGDFVVNGLDFNLILGEFGNDVELGHRADTNRNGKVDGLDFDVILTNFGQVCSVSVPE